MNSRLASRALSTSATRTSRPATLRQKTSRWRGWAPELLEDRRLLSTFTVSDLSGNPNDAGSLPHAVQLANAAPGSTIVFQSGLVGVIPLAATIQVTAPMTITGPGASSLVLLGGGAQSGFNILSVVSPQPVTISGLAITGGNAGVGQLGGGIGVFQSDLNLANCVITNCTSVAGGGIADFGTITMTNCVVAGNSAGNGGGIMIAVGEIMTMTNCTVAGNRIDASGIEGGGIDNRGNLTMTNCSVTGNSAQNNGGGIGNLFGSVTLINTSITGNTGTVGGGIFNEGSAKGPVTLTNCTVSGNSANRGGGIAAEGGKLTLNGSIVANNHLLAAPQPPSDIQGNVNPASAFNIIGAGGSGGLVNGVNNNIVIAPRRHPRPRFLTLRVAHLGQH